MFDPKEFQSHREYFALEAFLWICGAALVDGEGGRELLHSHLFKKMEKELDIAQIQLSEPH